jgi:hypothetical protein
MYELLSKEIISRLTENYRFFRNIDIKDNRNENNVTRYDTALQENRDKTGRNAMLNDMTQRDKVR